MSTSFSIHPNVYATGGPTGLVQMLEEIWVRSHRPGDGAMYIISGFGNYNGAVRFLDTFKAHTGAGGEVKAIFAGSTSQRLTSRQVVAALLESGADVRIVNRKRLLHAKCYGTAGSTGENLVVSSGNFTGPGMGLNVESSVSVPDDVLRGIGFSWSAVTASLLSQPWDVYQPILGQESLPAWKLLYDEFDRAVELDESDETTLLVLLGHADTARVQADPGTEEGKGSQYFWLSRDCYGFFPPLTIRNARGYKATFSCLIRLKYIDIGGEVDEECRVTFEAENNLDFRLGTGKLRYSRLASAGDIAAISRVGEREYELRIVRQGDSRYRQLLPYMVTEIGHQGKRYGFIDNIDFSKIVGERVGSRPRRVPAVRPSEPS